MPSASFAGFRALARQGNVVPVCLELLADCLTPVTAWMAAAGRSRRSFLLESIEGGERIARYSFAGRDPYLVLSSRGPVLTEQRGGARRRREGELLEALREHLRGLRPAPAPGLPRFTGGAVGYISWETARRFEPSAGEPAAGGRGGTPDAWFGFYDTVLAFDHARQTLLLIASVLTDRDGRALAAQHRDALRRLESLASALARGPSAAAGL
ncbi:MAG TPA: anthranilate synthase component I, partial [Candidatus Polarisedimenticolia bacterium]|nr:anthranilate synthase component I [Candidatus Polarisedimenticolia bacterium]